MWVQFRRGQVNVTLLIVPRVFNDAYVHINAYMSGANSTHCIRIRKSYSHPLQDLQPGLLDVANAVTASYVRQYHPSKAHNK